MAHPGTAACSLTASVDDYMTGQSVVLVSDNGGGVSGDRSHP